jgi:hypothetical protein
MPDRRRRTPRRALAVLTAAVASASSPHVAGAAGAPVRAEAPIREVALSNGDRRYAVPIRIGGTALDAGLDTGSSGLRVLQRAVPPEALRPSGRGSSYSYGAGAKLDGVVARADVSMGELTGATEVELVRHVGCSGDKPHCAAGSIPVEQYGIQGDGLPGEGFGAILGANMASAEIPSLLAGIGARRWIVELPRPGEPGPGRLVLNPSDAEVQGFVRLPIAQRYADRQGGMHDGVSGCLRDEGSGRHVCGTVLLDTGAPGIRVLAPDAPVPPWPEGTPATLTFMGRDGRPAAVERLVIGRREHASRLTAERQDAAPAPAIFAGLSPYFAFTVLYDPQHGEIGLKPRPPAPPAPEGALP